MKKFGLGFLSASVLVALSAWAVDRPALPQCGELLPEGVSYTLTLAGTWDTRTNPISGGISITLKDEISGDMPDPIPENAEAFVECVVSAVGV